MNWAIVIFLFWAGPFSCQSKVAPIQKGNMQPSEEKYKILRNSMVDTQIAVRGIGDNRVLAAMRKVLRHKFVPASYETEAYDDRPLPIGEGQTISQPYIVAYMTEQMGLKGGEKVLEVGTGSGYQAAVLAEIVKEVYSIEILEALSKTAEKVLKTLAYQNVFLRVGDGYNGWPEKAPFDAIIITAAPPKLPEKLIGQLKVGGVMIVPVGTYFQSLIKIIKTEKGFSKKELLPVRFVPMTGKIQKD